jgi:hypothetical protein
MGNLIDRDRLSVKGLGGLRTRQLTPTADVSFSYLSYLEETNFKDIIEIDIVRDETGVVINAPEQTRGVMVEPVLQQTSKDEIDFIKYASGHTHAVQYFGMANPTMFQYYCVEKGVVVPKIEFKYDAKSGKRLLPMQVIALKQDTLGYDVPEYYQAEAKTRIDITYLQLWLNARLGLNVGTDRALDISGFANHAQFNSDYASIWQAGTAPERFWRLDGVNDGLAIGNKLNDDGSADFIIELWVRVQAANGTAVIFAGKKNLSSDNSAGFVLMRNTSNQLVFKISNGSTSVSVTSVATILQNVWTHIAVAVDRNGNATVYINGVASGTPQSVSALSSGTNAVGYYVGRTESGEYSQIDFSAMRHHLCGAGNLQSDIAVILLRHYNGEKGYVGL